MAILERAAVTPTKPKFYTRFVDGIFYRKGKYKPDDLYHKINNYHCNIMLTGEKGSYKFLDIKLYNEKRSISHGSISQDDKIPKKLRIKNTLKIQTKLNKKMILM